MGPHNPLGILFPIPAGRRAFSFGAITSNIAPRELLMAFVLFFLYNQQKTQQKNTTHPSPRLAAIRFYPDLKLISFHTHTQSPNTTDRLHRATLFQIFSNFNPGFCASFKKKKKKQKSALSFSAIRDPIVS